MTLQLLGPSGAGKSVQTGLLAQHVHRTTGRSTVMYHADPGGYAHLAPHIERGYLHVVDMNAYSPWKSYESAVRGLLPPPEPYKMVAGKRTPQLWVPNPDADRVGLYAFEGMSSWGWKMAADILALAQRGVNIGGAGKADMLDPIPGEDTKLGNLSRNNYGQIQKRIKKLVWDSFELQAGRVNDVYVVWTALDHTGEDETGGQRLLGSKILGSAMASETPQWFNQTYHLVALPDAGRVEYRLYTRVHIDPANSMVWGLANTRAPLELGDDGELITVEIPEYISPANIIKALALVEGKKEQELVRS